MSSSPRPGLPSWAGVALLSAALACSKGARSPEEAYAAFHAAVTAKDARRLFAALDLETRWSWMSIRRAQRDAYDLVSTAFPESARAHQLARLKAAADSGSAADLFVSVLDPKLWAKLSAGLPSPTPAFERPGPNEAIARATDGRALPFRLGPKEGWGFAGLAGKAEEHKRRAIGDLDLVKASAADYERTQGSR